MAEVLRSSANQATGPDQPNMNVVPPAAPLGSGDAATTAGARERGDSILREEEAPPHLLEPYGEAREREWPLGAIPGRGIFERAGVRVRSAALDLCDGAWAEDIRERAEGFKERATALRDDFQHATVRLSHELQRSVAGWTELAQSRAQDLRASTEELINQRPARAIAVAAGLGMALGIVLRVSRIGRSHREY